MLDGLPYMSDGPPYLRDDTAYLQLKALQRLISRLYPSYQAIYLR